jgi:sulfane dehydrogenase subunit SoxC
MSRRRSSKRLDHASRRRQHDHFTTADHGSGSDRRPGCPCPEKPWTELKKGDIVEIEGIAWSGKGTISAVDITFDGGKNWVEAKLKGLVLPKAWTRFSYLYKYEGKPLLLASRSVDDSGDVQPTINQEKKIIGVEGVYHRNSINTWQITEKGEVHNAHIRS